MWPTSAPYCCGMFRKTMWSTMDWPVISSFRGFPMSLKVRIIADMEDRIREEMKRENLTAEKARYLLKKDDDERRKWSLMLYGIDTWDPSLYDIVLNIKSLQVDDAVKIILDTLKIQSFQTTEQSQSNS